jgi:uncharacterized protein YheU (UPF0270 family)
MIIPWQELHPDTLQNLLESFVLREGTDYGDQEIPLSEKVAQLHTQLNHNQLVVVYSELHESINIMTKDEFASMTHSPTADNEWP